MAPLDQILTKRRCIIIAEKLIEVLTKSLRVEISLVNYSRAILPIRCILINRKGFELVALLGFSGKRYSHVSMSSSPNSEERPEKRITPWRSTRNTRGSPTTP